jgi:hypothetical protein
MKIGMILFLVVALFLSACRNTGDTITVPKSASNEKKSSFSKYSVDPDFTGGDSVMIAARRVFPDCRHIELNDAVLGADAHYEYAMFFAGRDTRGGFEAIYYRYLIFAKLKSEPDWSSARVFDWPGRFEPFTGPIEALEKQGEELGKEPIKSSTAQRP